MAVTETVKIVFEVENKELDATLEKLVKQKVITEEAAQGYRDLAKATSEADAAQRKNTQSIDQYIAKIAQAKDTVARLTKENAGLKNFVDFKSSNAAVQEINKKFLDNEKLIRAAKLEVKQFQAELDKLDPKPVPTEEFVSLKTRIREAKDELAQATEQFGPFSQQALEARKKAGELTAQLDDLNRQTKLIEPEDRIKAFQALGGSIVGAFQVATGTLQAFGAENEEVQKIAQKLQGALNVVQGIQSLIQVKEAYEDIKAVLGFTQAAQTALTTATTAGTVATEGAAVATRGFAAALTSTGIGAIVVAIGALVGAMILLGDETDETSKKSARLLELEAERKRLAGDAVASARALAVARGELSDIDAKRQEQEERDNELIRQKSEELAKLAPKYQILRKQLDQFIAGGGTAEEFFGARSDEARDVIQGYEEIQKQLVKIREKAVTDSLILNEEEKKANQDKNQKEIEDNKRKLKEQKDAEAAAAEERKQAKLKALDEELAALAEAQRGALIGVDDELQRIAITDSFRAKITAKQIERAKVAGESITLIEQKAANDQRQSFEDLVAANEAQRDKDVANAEKAAADKLAAEQKLLQEKKALLAQEEALALLQNQVTATDETDLAEKNFNTQRDFLTKRIELEKAGSLEQQKLLAELDLLYKNYEKGKTKTAEDEAAERRQIAAEAAQEAFDFIFELNQQSFQRESEELQKQKEQGLITEEQYQEKLKQLKAKQARADKEAAIFNATIQFSQALINALTTTPATAAPAALALAAAVAGLNLAKIIATPLPKFKQGTLAVPGYDTGDDSVMAMLRPGEAVIPTEINREYASAIKAIYTRKVSAKDLNEFVAGRMSVVKDEPVFNFNPITLDALYKRDLRISQMSSAVQRSTGGVMPTINVKADLDTYALGKVISKNKTMEVSNVESIGEAVATALSKRTNRRQQI